MTKSDYEVQEVIFDKCPICNRGKVESVKQSSFLGLIKTDKILCNNCKANFDEGENREEERVFKLDLSNSNQKSKYNGQALKVSEWKRGLSDLDYNIENNLLPKLKVVGLKIILQDNEQTHWYSGSRLMEERMVRNVQSYGIRGRGFYSGQSRGESHGELKTIDNGSLLLTNQRLIFNGNFKNIDYKLNKIISVEEFQDAVEIGVSNKQKLQTYVVDEPHKWAVYIRMAIKRLKSDKPNNYVEMKSKQNSIPSLKEQVYKTKESFNKIKKQLVKIQKKKKNEK